MATPLKKPKIRLGLSDLINQIAAQANFAQQYPPTGTTPVAPAAQPVGGMPRIDATGTVQYRPYPSMQPAPQSANPMDDAINPNTYYQTRPTESLAANPAQAPAGSIDPRILTNMMSTRPTESSTLQPYSRGGYPTGQMEGGMPPGGAAGGMPRIDATGTVSTSQPQGQAQTAPGAAPAAAPAPASKSPYASVADILAEAPPASNDPKAYFQFNMDQMNKIGQFYGMTPDEISQKAAEVQAQIIGASNTKDETGKVVTRQLGNSEVQRIWDNAKTGIIAQKDFNPEAAMNGTSTTGQQSSPMMADTYDPASNPLSQYGVYTPEEIAGIQAAIGQYVQSGQDQFAQKTGFKAPDATSQAYMAQAQAIPAIQALEGQAALARKVYEQQQQLQYYQIMAQMPQSQSQGTTDPSLQSYLDQNGLAPQGG